MPRFGPQFNDRPILATGEVKYHGEPLAIVAAETKEVAAEAARLVRVEFEELPAIFTVAGALDPAAALVQDPALRPDDPLARSNVLREHLISWGTSTPRWRTSSSRTRTPSRWSPTSPSNRTDSWPLPTAAALRCGAQSSIQNWLQKILARLLGLPLSKVRVLAPDPGGAFGGKQHTKYEPIVAFAALRAGAPGAAHS